MQHLEAFDTTFLKSIGFDLIIKKDAINSELASINKDLTSILKELERRQENENRKTPSVEIAKGSVETNSVGEQPNKIHSQSA